MPGPESNSPLESTREEKYLADEYKALIDLDGARNERLDRFLTIFMSLAAAPWALYALSIKDHPGTLSLLTLPSLVGVVFMLTGILGILVAMMYVQVRFNIILYMRAVNAIRDYFLEAHTRLSFQLPRNSKKPPYYEKGSYVQYAVAGMGLVNSGYIGLGAFTLFPWPGCFPLRLILYFLLSAVFWCGHIAYYFYQAERREQRSDKEPRWHSK